MALSYAKSQGSAVTATFAWSFSNSSGTSFLNGDVGTRFSISAGQAKHQIFYYTGLTIPSGYPCVRGELWVGATTYVTKIIC